MSHIFSLIQFQTLLLQSYEKHFFPQYLFTPNYTNAEIPVSSITRQALAFNVSPVEQ